MIFKQLSNYAVTFKKIKPFFMILSISLLIIMYFRILKIIFTLKLNKNKICVLKYFFMVIFLYNFLKFTVLRFFIQVCKNN